MPGESPTGRRPPEEVPNRLLFVWIGRDVPFGAVVAVRSAHRVCRSRETILIGEGLDARAPGVRALTAEAGVRIDRDPLAWFDGLPTGGVEARRLYRSLPSPRARANLLRLAALWQRGGVYLDTDTITIRDLADLRRLPGFCGSERVVVSGALWRNRSPLPWAAAGLRQAVRWACTLGRSGVAAFRRVERYYPTVASNAVLAAAPRNPLLTRAFQVIAGMSPGEQRRRYALGVYLLQGLTGNRSGPQLTVLPPDTFHPLGPEVSIHWFEDGSADRLSELISPATRIVHWYDSVVRRRGEPRIHEAYVRRWRHRVAFARMAFPYLE